MDSGGLGSDFGPQKNGKPGKAQPKDVLFIDGAPHDWLFQCCRAVIHHGGAGTTATGLTAALPTWCVTFFGDQPFWGAACERAGVGPASCPIDDLSTDRIVDALKELILPSRLKAAQALSEKMAKEDGIAATVDHIHHNVYSVLLGRRQPPWMRTVVPVGTASSTQASTMATSQIREFETEDGEGLLRGMLRLPTYIAKSFVGFLTGKSQGSALPTPGQPLSSHSAPGYASAGTAGSSDPLSATTGRGATRAFPARPAPAVAESGQRNGFLSFFGC
mmetsp:Transcript_3007/g.5169  ORF Transcript_3007/g.5169 Transcript_3007/m.5169 type:complete len:276 (-) Transcript_3007:72-899(-)